MSHPSIFELARFVETGCESAEFESHVDACDDCAKRLAELARRAMRARGLSSELVVHQQSPAMVPVMMAFLACVAVLLSGPMNAVRVSAPAHAVAPEGMHGTPFLEESVSGVVFPGGFGDAGSGSRSD